MKCHMKKEVSLPHPVCEPLFLSFFGDAKGASVEDFLKDRLPSVSEGPSSSNYPSL
jgi:hypothetical protein